MDKLSCKERFIYNLIIDGELEAMKLGSRAVRISEQSVDRFIERRKIKPEDFFDPDKEKTQTPAIPTDHQIARSKFIGR